MLHRADAPQVPGESDRRQLHSTLEPRRESGKPWKHIHMPLKEAQLTQAGKGVSLEGSKKLERSEKSIYKLLTVIFYKRQDKAFGK